MRKITGIKVVITSGSKKIQKCLQKSFTERGASIELCGFLNTHFVEQIEQACVDVILIDMDDSYEEDEEALDLLLERTDVPILFHDNDFDECNDPSQGCGFSKSAIDKLVDKLSELVENSPPKLIQTDEVSKPSTYKEPSDQTRQVAQNKVLDEGEQTTLDTVELSEEVCVKNTTDTSDELVLLSAPDEEPKTERITINVKEIAEIEQQLINKKAILNPTIIRDQSLSNGEGRLVKEPLVAKKTPEKRKYSTNNKKSCDIHKDDFEQAVNVWVLGSSVGGPESVKRFLERIPEELPVAFVLAQHLGKGFVMLLANQLDRVSRFKVKEAIVGDTLKHGEVVVVPVENRMTLSKKGKIDFIDEKWKGHYRPSIDCVINDVTSSYKTKSGVIIFSGMGADGVLASQQFVDKYKGTVWAQTSETCVVSSMPDSVRKANLVSYSGSPEALAVKISIHYMGKNSYINK